jgi:hypothetical protein
MEKIGLSLTSHKSSISSITVVSDGTVSEKFLDKVKQAHKTVDAQYKDQIQQIAILSENFDQNIIAELLELGGLNLHLLRGMNFDQDQVRFILKKHKKELHKHEVGLLASLINLPSQIQQNLKVDTLMDYLEKKKELNTAEAARTIILAVEKNILTPRVFAMSENQYSI